MVRHSVYLTHGFTSCADIGGYLFISILIRYTKKEGYAYQTEVAKAFIAFFFLYYVFFGTRMVCKLWSNPQYCMVDRILNETYRDG